MTRVMLAGAHVVLLMIEVARFYLTNSPYDAAVLTLLVVGFVLTGEATP